MSGNSHSRNDKVKGPNPEDLRYPVPTVICYFINYLFLSRLNNNIMVPYQQQWIAFYPLNNDYEFASVWSNKLSDFMQRKTQIKLYMNHIKRHQLIFVSWLVQPMHCCFRPHRIPRGECIVLPEFLNDGLFKRPYCPEVHQIALAAQPPQDLPQSDIDCSLRSELHRDFERMRLLFADLISNC